MIIRIWSLFMARNREFYRDRSGLGWSILFPFLVIGGFALMFNEPATGIYKVGLIGEGAPASDSLADRLAVFQQSPYVDLIAMPEVATAIDKLRHHSLDMVLDARTGDYWVSETSPGSYMVERLLLSDPGEGAHPDLRKKVVTGREVPYVEWLFPGVLGMNMMFSGLYGVGYVVVRYRKNGVLKRLSATPMRAAEFLVSQILSRIVAMLITTAIVYIGCSQLFGFACRGSYLLLLLVFVLGAFSMIALGLLMAARISSEELAGGLLNILSWPMMFLSGVWFSLEGAKPWVKALAQTFPLTHLIDAARLIINDGAGFADIRLHLTVLLSMSLTFLALGSLFFEWKKK